MRHRNHIGPYPRPCSLLRAAVIVLLLYVWTCISPAASLATEYVQGYAVTAPAYDSAADIPLDYILQKDDQSDEVARVQQRLSELGYLNDAADGIFGKNTESAVQSFQEAAGLNVTGKVDYDTFIALFAENAPTITPEKNKSEEEVWIPRTGKKYHRKETCSNMKNPTKVTVSEAIRQGFDKCKKCYK